MISSIIEMFDGGPVGLDTLAACTGEDPITIEDVYEPYLMQLGYLAKTPRGRVLTRLAYDHLGVPYPERQDKHLKGLGNGYTHSGEADLQLTLEAVEALSQKEYPAGDADA